MARDIVVVASAGNNGAAGTSRNTYPAALDGVIAVAASDRNNERALFSQRGDFVDIAAPGVDVVSTVPLGGQCADSGTSFAAPYVSGVVALTRAKHPDWTVQQVTAQIQQTAERAVSGRDRHVGWGVVDPVRALTEDSVPIDRPVAREGMRQAEKPQPAELHLHETYAERNERLGTYVLLASLVLTGLIAPLRPASSVTAAATPQEEQGVDCPSARAWRRPPRPRRSRMSGMSGQKLNVRIFGEQIEALSLVVDMSQKGFDNAEAEQIARFHKLQENAQRHYQAQDPRPDSRDARAGSTGSVSEGY